MALQPIPNYLANIQGGQSPLEQYITGQQGLQAVQANRMNLEQARQQQAQQQAFQEALRGDTLDFGALASQFPEQAQTIEQIRQLQGLAQQEQSAAALRGAGQLYEALGRGDVEGAAAILEQNRPFIDGNGDPSFTTDRALAMLQEDPEQLRQIAGGMLRLAQGPGTVLEAQADLSPADAEKYSIERAKIAQREREAELRRLEQELKGEENALKREELELKIEGLKDEKEDFGRAGPQVYRDTVQTMREDQTGVTQLNRALNIAFDAEEAGVSLIGSNMSSYINKFRELGGFDTDEDARFAQAYGSASLDIARQLAQALRPVSGEQLKLVLDSLRGGSWGGVQEAIRGTMIQTAQGYADKYDFLEREGANAIKAWPRRIGFERTPGVIDTERQAISANPEQPQRQAPQAAIEYLRANPQFADQFREKYGYLPEGL